MDDRHIVAPHATSDAACEQLARLGSARLARFIVELARSGEVRDERLSALLHDGPGAPPAASAGAADSYMVGSSPAMRRIFDQIRRFAASGASVLITGESGTGKELAARAIHDRSRVASGPFVAINCAALPASLISAELFGHERGAFTGAIARKVGRIELAHKGTIFLDEIGDMPVDMQAHLLRFLQERTFERVGGTKPITVEVRVIAATNMNLEDAIARGKFREDLYYRLNELPLAMPPLRERTEDILLLAKFFLKKFAQEMDRPVEGFEPAAEQAIMAHAWPGNVRELIACVRRCVITTDNRAIRTDELGLAQPSLPSATAPRSLGEVRAKTEGQLIRNALAANNFNVTRAARTLGVSRVTLYRLIEKYRIEPRRRSARSHAATAPDRRLPAGSA
jgi:DNA-binding NtrC family response regulator